MATWGGLFVNRERFDIYVCPHCGRVEFFIDGIWESLRPFSRVRNPRN